MYLAGGKYYQVVDHNDNVSQSSLYLSIDFLMMAYLCYFPSEFWLPSCVVRQSSCELEVDVVAADITNTAQLSSQLTVLL